MTLLPARSTDFPRPRAICHSPWVNNQLRLHSIIHTFNNWALALFSPALLSFYCLHSAEWHQPFLASALLKQSTMLEYHSIPTSSYFIISWLHIMSYIYFYANWWPIHLSYPWSQIILTPLCHSLPFKGLYLLYFQLFRYPCSAISVIS